jgi:hypothetical protein
MLKWIATGVVVAVAVGAAGSLFAAKAVPGRAVTLAPPAVPVGDKPFARICKSGELTDARPDPAWVGASFARDNCRAPAMPAAVDGFTASREQVVAGMAALKSYAAASDAFQECIRDFVSVRRTEASQNKKPVNMSLVIIENHRIIASENNKKKVAEQVKVAINAFNEYGSGCAE